MKNLLDNYPQKLNKEDEAKLAQGSPKDLEKLVLHSMREAVAYTRHVSKGHIEDGELIDICYDVLSRGSKRWKTGFVRFVAFCKPGLRGYVYRSWKEKNVVKGVGPERMVFQGRKDNDAKILDKVGDGHGLWDVEEEVAPEHEIDQPAFGEIHTREQWAMVRPIMERVCTAREQAILNLAYFSGRNFQEIAKKLDLTRSAIQRTHRVALRKIRVALLDQKRLLSE